VEPLHRLGAHQCGAGGAGTLIVWSRAATGAASGDLFAARLDGADNVSGPYVLDGRPYSYHDNINVAFDGRNYLAVWSEELCTRSPGRALRRLRAAVETARYERRQACLRRLPTPPPPTLVEAGGESPQGDFVLLVAREFIRRVGCCRSSFRLCVQSRSEEQLDSIGRTASACTPIPYTGPAVSFQGAAGEAQCLIASA